MKAELPRPNPELLSPVPAEAQQKLNGRLKVFLGYAAGVGKTYAMLEAAHQRLTEGRDVVIGFVETHQRAETDALLMGLEVIPSRQVDYAGTRLTEMDLDSVLARRPQLVLVDELAHSNAPGSRHPKRYQDVEELLGAGIDIYTTLNVQHLESLKDIVTQITSVVVRETIPDSLINRAADIELVDLPPSELIQRFNEGKVYMPEQAARTGLQFFREGNLTALRELAMRRAAYRVDEQMRAYMRTRAIRGPWPASERLLVCVGSGPLGDQLIRTGRRLSDELKAEWFALHVEMPGRSQSSPSRSKQISRLMRLAEELGARVKTLPGDDVAEVALAYAKKHNITKIVVGKSLRPRWRAWLGHSPIDRIVRQDSGVDVYLVSSVDGRQTTPLATQDWIPHRPLRRYAISFALVAAATLAGLPFVTLLSPVNLVMLYLLVVVASAVYLGRGPAILASITGVLAFDYFFVPPRFTLAVAETEYVFTFAALFGVSLVISGLATRAREQAEDARRREAQTAELYDLSRDLASASSLNRIAGVLVSRIEQILGRQVAVLLPDETSQSLEVIEASTDLSVDGEDKGVAAWVYSHGEPAGYDTNTLPGSRLRFLPLGTARGVLGVLGVGRPDAPLPGFSPEQVRLLESFASQAALAIERSRLDEQARKADLLRATEELQSALLNSISHDLRTPLVSITGALSSLEEDGSQLDELTRLRLVHNARGESERLNRLVGNLLDMTRLEAGALRLKLEACDIQDVIGAALEQLSARLGNRQVNLNVPDNIPMVSMDFVTITQVLVNLLDNALKYSPDDSPIDVDAGIGNGHLEVAVADRGVGIPREHLAKVFDKFHRVQQTSSVGGTGLGLSICKGIIEAHGGYIGAENRPGGGSIFTFALPAA